MPVHQNWILRRATMSQAQDAQEACARNCSFPMKQQKTCCIWFHTCTRCNNGFRHRLIHWAFFLMLWRVKQRIVALISVNRVRFFVVYITVQAADSPFSKEAATFPTDGLIEYFQLWHHQSSVFVPRALNQYPSVLLHFWVFCFHLCPLLPLETVFQP